MKVKLAKSSGFCMGVRRAVELALEAVHTCQGPIYSHGPLIHNPQAVALLESKGLKALDPDESSLDGLKGGTVIIRAHGVPPSTRKDLEERGFDIIDATCPRVIRVQAIIRKHTAQGYTPIIWGNPDHPEVIGLLGHAEGRGLVVRRPEDIAGLPDQEKVILVAQTTQHKQVFKEMVRAVQDRWPEALVFDTICGATERRQEDVRRLAREVQAMVVVGGHSSGNTQRLAEVAQAEGVKTIHIETEDELDTAWLQGVETVGVTAGASTPNWMIKRVIRTLERLARKVDVSLQTVSRRLLRILILSNVYAAAGAGSLCLAGAMLQDLKPRMIYFGVTFFYVHAMHMLNLFLDKEASQYNDPDRVLFLEKHKVLLLNSGIFSAVVGLGLSFLLGLKVFLLLIFMSTLGLLYAVPLVPGRLVPLIRFKRLKDIPVSKTLSLSGGWAVCLGLVPALSPDGVFSPATILVLVVIFMLVFVRSALGDILEIQGDRIVGRETIPIIIGEKNTLALLNLITLASAVVLMGGWGVGVFNTLALVLVLCSGYAAFCLYLFRRNPVMGSGIFEAVIDANFILAGLLSWIWAALC